MKKICLFGLLCCVSASVWAQNLTNTQIIRDSIAICQFLKLAGERSHWNKNTIQYLDSALNIAEKSDWKVGKGRVLFQKADYYVEMGLYEISNKTLFDALPILKQYDTKQELFRVLIQIQQIQWDFAGTEDLSIQTGQENLKLAQSLKDTALMGLVMEHIGHAYVKKKEYNKAVLAFKKSIFWYGKKHQLISEIYLARALVGAKRFDEAAPFLKKIHVIDSGGTEFERYYSHMILAEAYAEVGQFKKALAHNLISNKVYGDGVWIMHDIEIFKNYYRIYKDLKQYDLAFKYLEKLMETEKKLSYNTLNKGFAEYQIRYRSQEKQQQIDQLTISQQAQTQKILLGGMLVLFGLVGYVFYNNRQLRRKNQEISESLLRGQTLERKRVAADLHDNLGSTLSSIRWSMQAIDKKKLSTDEQNLYINLQEMLDKAHNDIRLLSHNLLPEELEKQGLWDTLQSFIRKLNKNTLTHFDLQLPDNQDRLSSKIEFELYSICLELTNNILKHANATEARLVFERQNGSLHLHISDNGKGLDATRQNGKGLANVAARVEALGGKWQVKNGETGVANMIVVPV